MKPQTDVMDFYKGFTEMANLQITEVIEWHTFNIAKRGLTLHDRQ